LVAERLEVARLGEEQSEMSEAGKLPPDAEFG